MAIFPRTISPYQADYDGLQLSHGRRWYRHAANFGAASVLGNRALIMARLR
ncbi:MAG: hypothetical protein AAF221_01615 [Pseudomonadota bacterium]